MKKRVILLFLLAVTLLAWGCGSNRDRESGAKVYVAGVEGEIDRRTADYVQRVISEAEEAGADAVALRLDTPGGRLDHTERIVEAQGNAEKLPVIVYVPEGARAVSAGTFIIMASDVAAMGPQTRLGAAAPVGPFGQDIPGTLGDKVTSDAAALLRSLAAAHGRNEEWAERAVREAASANAEEALNLGVIEYVEPDLRAVLKAADGSRVEPKRIRIKTAGAALVEKPPNFRERFGIPLYTAVIAATLAVLAAIGVAVTVVRTSRWRVSTGREGMIGEIGVVRKPIAASSGGVVMVHGELWKALAENPDDTPIETGTEVEVVGFRRTAVIVRR